MKLRQLLILACTFFLWVLIVDDTCAQSKYSKYKGKAAKGKSIGKYKGIRNAGKFHAHQYMGIMVNAFNYYGDMAPVNRAASTDISFTRPGLGFTFGHRFHPGASLRANFNWGWIKAEDFSSGTTDREQDPSAYGRYMRNLSFRNHIKEFNVGFNMYFLPQTGSVAFRLPLNGYIFVGAGVYHHAPKGLVSDVDAQTGELVDGSLVGTWVDLRKLGTEGQQLDPGTKDEIEARSGTRPADPYPLINFQIPVALGVTMKLPANFDLRFEMGYRFAFTDYLDDVSDQYVSLSHFGDNDLARMMSDRSAELQDETIRKVALDFNGSSYTVSGDIRDNAGDFNGKRGNPENNDVYFITQFKLVYLIPESSRVGKRQRAAKFR
ncbi:MAG: hypothetical protein JXQ90_12945 [Cyclobacteriaceae bacterium]